MDATPVPNLASVSRGPTRQVPFEGRLASHAPRERLAVKTEKNGQDGKIKRVLAFVTPCITWRPIAAHPTTPPSLGHGPDRGCRANVVSKAVKGFVAGAASSYGPHATLGHAQTHD